jgi:hypothetical protein
MQDSKKPSEQDAVREVSRLQLIPKGARGVTHKPSVAPQVGNAWVAHQALGLPSPSALTKKFTRDKNPWPTDFRTRDNGQWLYHIENIKAWLFGGEAER